MATISLRVIVWGEPQHIITDDSVAFDRVMELAFEAAKVAGRYAVPARWELRFSDGSPIDAHRSVASYQVGDDARIFLSPRAGVAG